MSKYTKRVKMLDYYRDLIKGEDATLPAEYADNLVEKGFAEYIDKEDEIEKNN